MRLEDILEGIVKDGGLKTHEDDWDVKHGTVQTISTASARMYARLYATISMPGGKYLENELGRRALWGYYFFGTAKLVAWAEYPLRPHITDYPAKIARWTGKLSKQKHSLRSIFLEGTDIADNYPVLVGIRRGAFEPMPGSRFFNLHERRSSRPIAIDNFTHVEVPRQKVDETASMLAAAGLSVPVLPLEYGEEYCRSFSFRTLVGGARLVPKDKST